MAETLWSLRASPAQPAGTTRDPLVDFVRAPGDRPLAELEQQRERPGPHLAIDARLAQTGEPLDLSAASPDSPNSLKPDTGPSVSGTA